MKKVLDTSLLSDSDCSWRELSDDAELQLDFAEGNYAAPLTVTN